MGKFFGIVAFWMILVIGLALLTASTYNLVIMIISNGPCRYYVLWNIGGWIFFIIIITFLGKKIFSQRD